MAARMGFDISMRILKITLLHLLVIVFLCLHIPMAAKAQGKLQYLGYIGTYTREQSKGIYSFRFDAATGKVTEPELAAAIENPSFLAIHPSNKYLYAVSELSKGGAVSAFSIDEQTGKLTLLNTVPSKGAGPCNVSVDPTGHSVLIANYGGGSIAAFPILAQGKLGEAGTFIQHSGSGSNPKRQAGPHAHSVTLSPDNHYAIAADLGLDRLMIYRFDPATAKLTPNEPAYVATAPGAGPRHFAFHPNGRFAYVINELNSTVTGFNYERGKGLLRPMDSYSTLPKDFSGDNYPADLHIDPQGKFLYGSNRGHDSIAVFSIDASNGKLSPVEHVSTQGKNPRNFNIDPTGGFLLVANQNSNNIVIFRIDPRTGRLTPTSEELKVGSPVCVKFVPLNKR
jgi:6-phosphogluconolactonase